MRYLKLFEGFGTEDYYVEIDNEEYKSKEHNLEPFTDSDIKLLSGIKNILKIRYFTWDSSQTPSSSSDRPYYKEIKSSLPSSKFNPELAKSNICWIRIAYGVDKPFLDTISLYKSSDEYYYVEDCKTRPGKLFVKKYKCDQIEGLKKLLEDLDLI